MATEFSFDLAFSVARGTDLHLAYLSLCGGLMLGAAVVCAGLGARWAHSETRVALVLYVLAHGTPSARGLLFASVCALATWVALAPRERRVLGALDQGVVVGSALSAAIVLWRYAELALGLRTNEVTDPVHAIVFALILTIATLWQAIRAKAPALPSAATLAILLTAASVAAMALSVAHTRPRSGASNGALPTVPIPQMPDVLLLVMDTVRADHLPSYGYERDTAPNLARFVRERPEVVQFDLAFSTATWTIPAHGSLLSGTMQSVHGARSYSVTQRITFSAESTIAETMRDAGYCTAAIVANPFLLRVDGFRRGFDVFWQPPATRPLLLLGEDLRHRLLPTAFAGRVRPQPLADVINAELLRAHRECGKRPAFLLANYMDAHSPYLAVPPHAGRFAGARNPALAIEDAAIFDSPEVMALKRDRYDEELHFLDEQLQRLFDALESDGVLNDSWIFITADHGEAFGEHGVTSHGSGVYNEQVRIPLIVKAPRGMRLPPTRDPVSLLDVATTIAAIAGRDGFGAGRDLRSPPGASRSIGIEFSGTFRGASRYGDTADDPARAAVIGRFKLIVRDDTYELYDLAEDPHELDDLASTHGPVVNELATALPDAVRALTDIQPAGALHPDEKEALRELGYLQ